VQTSFTVTVGSDTTSPQVAVTSPTSDVSVTTNPTITGTATDNVAVTSLKASVDGGTAQTVTVGTGGSFSFTPTLATDGSADGKHTVVFTATDAASNNSTPVTVTFHLDTTAPVVMISSPTDNQTTAANPTISGTATDNQTVASLNASVDGATAQTVTVGAGGSFTFTPTLATDGSADGQHTVTFTATDAAGNTSAVATLHFTLSSANAAVTLTAPAAGQTFTTVPEFDGSVTSNIEISNLTASVDGGSPQPVSVSVLGSFTFTPTISTDGTHTVVFDAGSAFTPVSRSFVLDSTAPVVNISSPANGQSFQGSVAIVGTVADALSGVTSLTYSLDGGTPQPVAFGSGGAFSFQPGLATDGSADGQHTVALVATDGVGNVSQAVSVTFRLDTTPPSVTITSPSDNVSGKTDPVLTGTISDAGGVSSVLVSVNGGIPQAATVDSQGNFTFDPHLATDGSADGFYTFVVVGRDVAGNSTTLRLHYTLDTTPPVATIQSPNDGQTFTTNPTITVSATDNTGTSFAFAIVDGTQVNNITFPTNTSFTFTPNLPLDGTANGQHTVEFIAQDSAVNQSTPVIFHFTLNA
jgi:hypothetical protein